MTILEHSYIYHDHCENYHDYHIMAIFSRGALIIGSAIGNTLCLLIFISHKSIVNEILGGQVVATLYKH